MTQQKQQVTPINHPVRLSHGTLECRDLVELRRFYEEFLGMECVRHGSRSMLARKGGYWSIVCIEVGDKVHPMGLWNHWGLDLQTKEDVDRAHEMALQHKDTYGLDKITPAGMRHGTYQFHFRDRDGNWWEFQYSGKDRYDHLFSEGDAYPMDAPAASIKARP